MSGNNCHCHMHYKACGKSHGKEHLKRKALIRPRKTDMASRLPTGNMLIFFHH